MNTEPCKFYGTVSKKKVGKTRIQEYEEKQGKIIVFKKVWHKMSQIQGNTSTYKYRKFKSLQSDLNQIRQYQGIYYNATLKINDKRFYKQRNEPYHI